MKVLLLLKNAMLQLGLFDVPVQVAPHVKKDGTVVKPYTATRKKRQKKAKDFKAQKDTVKVDNTAGQDSQEVDNPGPGDISTVQPIDLNTIKPFGVPAGTSKAERKRLNAKAREMLDKPYVTITDEDKAVLRQYSGTGGIGDSLNEYYTDPKVAAAMWHVLDKLGVSGGSILEPSVGTGVFMHTAPVGAHVVGVEMEPGSAKICRMLHKAHEVHTSTFEAFATQDTRQFAAVIGNPPYGEVRGELIKADKPDMKTPQTYFIDAALDKTQSGGIVSMVVPTSVLDSKNGRKFRERMLRKAEFLGAIRMPNTAFEAAHTEVTTDVFFMRKRPQEVAGALMTVDQATLKAVGVWDDEFLAGTYFIGRGADNVLGSVGTEKRAFGEIYAVHGSMQGVPEAIAAFKPEAPRPGPSVQDILTALGDDENAKSRARAGAIKTPYEKCNAGDTKVVDGVTYILDGKPLRWHRMDEVLESEAVKAAQPLAAMIDRLMTGEGADRPTLEAGVRAFIETHGDPTKHPDILLAAKQDKTLYRLIGAVKPDGTLSDVVLGKYEKPAKNSFDGTVQSLALEVGNFTVKQLADRWGGGDADLVLDHLHASEGYALNPDGTWTTMESYLSGEMWPKFDAVTEALQGDDVKLEDRARYERQAKALTEAIDPQSLEDVECLINSGFIPLPVVAAFFNAQKAEAAVGSTYIASQDDYHLTFNDGVFTVHGGTYGSNLLRRYLNRAGVKKDDLPTIERWNKEFKAWLCSSEWREQVEDLYNRKFRGFRKLKFSDAPIDIPGLANRDKIQPYTWPGLRWALATGKGIIAADVGLGKTIRGLMLARMAKLNEQCKKPMIVVPKSVLANWLAEVEKWFPGLNVLTVGETYTKDADGNLKGVTDSAAERARKYHDLTQNDYDLTLISEPAFTELDLNPEAKNDYHSNDFWVQRGDAMDKAGDKRSKKIRESYAQAMANREFNKRSDAIYFDDLGVDMLILDEAHHYKNLYAAKARFGGQPKFLGGQGLSNRALDTTYKARWIRDHNGGKNVYGLTATPTKNSPLEIYSMLSHIAPEEFERIGIRNSEEFLDRFCSFETGNVLSTASEIEEAMITAGFKNMDELREVMLKHIDRTTAEDVGLKLPERNDHQHFIDMSAGQQAAYAGLRAQLAECDKSSTGDAHIFSIINKMSKAALDLELLDGKAHKGEVSPKYMAAAKEIVAGAKEGGQVVFSDFIESHEKIAAALVAAGIPRNQIGIVNAQVAPNSAKRQNIADAFNAGKLKVVIGNTATMGEGINLQITTTDIHHMDLPWEPASIQQRNGRGLRQGNTNEGVRIHTYLSRASFDGYRYQALTAKKNWQDLIWSGGNKVENLAREGALSHDDIMVMMAADPDAARASLATNKAAAQERFDADGRRDAAEVFVKFQDLRRASLSQKGKQTAGAERLRVKLERTKTILEADKHFPHKQLLDLDTDTPVLVHSVSGHAFYPGSAFDVAKQPDASIDSTGKFVVTHVDMADGTIKTRRHGVVGSGTHTFDLESLKNGIKPFAYDEAAEKAEIDTSLSEAAKTKAQTVKGPKDVAGLPVDMMRERYADIQAQIKRAALSYEDNLSSSSHVAMIGPDGKGAIKPSYEHRKVTKDHDYMLPMPEHHERALAAWGEAERGKKFTHDYSYGYGRRKRHNYNQSNARLVQRYGVLESTNPWANAAKDLFGPGFEQEARKHFEREQFTRARHAKGFAAALGHLAPTVTIDYQGAHWPKRTLAILWAQAMRGDPKAPVKSLVNSTEAKVTADLFKIGTNPSANLADKDIQTALIELAKHNKYPDLAAAMAVHGTRGEASHEAAVHSLKLLTGIRVSPHGGAIHRPAMEAMLHVVDKAGLGEKTPDELDIAFYDYGDGSDAEKARPLRAILKEKLEAGQP